MAAAFAELRQAWTLSDAVDALAASAREGGVPRLLWVAGFFYPNLGLTLGEGGALVIRMVARAALPIETESAFEIDGGKVWLWLASTACLSIVFGFRMTAGLAQCSHPAGGPGQPRLRDVWSAGRAAFLPAMGLHVALILLLVMALFVLLGPVAIVANLTGLRLLSPPLFALLGLAVAIALGYAVMLGVLYQLALHSLVHNRRGVASALVHAWRLLCSDPTASIRATVVDFVLSAVVVVLSTALLMTVCLAPLVIPLAGFCGVTRAAYWARGYRALGGLAASDGVPGLET